MVLLGGGKFFFVRCFPVPWVQIYTKKDSSAKFMVKMYYFSVSKRVKISCLGMDKMLYV